MLIQPNTNIIILKNCPLDKTYEHTLYFDKDNVSAQTSYFKSLKKYSLTKQSYQRYDTGVLHVQIRAEDLYDCNYLMFQNESFGTKWFYAFITSIEYVNNVSSKIKYEIDVMQTWYFDYELGECFVEREHSSTDELFGNLVPENLDLGDEYVCNAIDVFDMNSMSICILYAPFKNPFDIVGEIQGKVVNNIYSPLSVIAGVDISNNPDDVKAIDAIVSEIVTKFGQEDRIVSIYQYPSFMGDSTDISEPVYRTKNIIVNAKKIDGYTPNNKKLFSHPYNFLLVSNNAGQTAEFKWENWLPGGASFKIGGVFVSKPSVLCYPTNHRGIEEDYDSGLTLNSFPMCPWVGDTYARWLAQNEASIATGMAINAISSGMKAGLFTGNPQVGLATGLVSAGTQIAQHMAKTKDLKNTPPQIHGQVQNESLNSGMRRVEFTFYSLSIKKQFAKIIDSYFDRYGYATHLTKTPNTNVRPHWTYTKTVGCTLTGSVPADDMRAIATIYDNGITFWKKGSEVGDYSLDNRPT